MMLCLDFVMKSIGDQVESGTRSIVWSGLKSNLNQSKEKPISMNC